MLVVLFIHILKQEEEMLYAQSVGFAKKTKKIFTKTFLKQQSHMQEIKEVLNPKKDPEWNNIAYVVKRKEKSRASLIPTSISRKRMGTWEEIGCHTVSKKQIRKTGKGSNKSY